MRWLIWVGVAAAVATVWWRRRGRAARQRRLMLLCRRAGLEFAPLDPFPDTQWLPFPMFGHPRRGSENVVWDRRQGADVHAFDFWYQDPADDDPIGVRRRLTCAVVPLAFSCSRLRVAPRDLSDDTKRAFGWPDVRLELEEFDRRFLVETEDARFATAFLDQRMMEALLRLPDDVVADVGEGTLLLWAPELPPEQVLRLLYAAIAIRPRIPRVLASLFPARPTRGPYERRWLQGRWSPDPTGDDVLRS
ncbi:MAG TPA: hypothetical protein VE915_04950 [Actinomycetota bacterium]|nr:hypothetical protein [Actinomycetota bacterium]